ncbi:hypothetical protein ACFLUT_01765 [Chloroflexota bacterium]
MEEFPAKNDAPIMKLMENSSATPSELKQWLASSQFHGSIAAFARYLGVPPKTAEDWFYRGAQPRGRTRLLLYRVTGLSCYAPRGETERLLLEELIRLDEVKLGERIQRFTQLLGELHAALDDFRDAPPSTRDELRRQLEGPEIAYLANMLQMLLNERRFQDWLAMSQLGETLGAEGKSGGRTGEGKA